MAPRDRLALVLIVLAWAGNFLLSAEALERIPPFWFTVLRFLVVLLLLFPFLRAPPARAWPLLSFVCLSTGALHFAFNFWALREGGIALVAILLQSYVPMSALLAALWLRERIGWRTAAGIGIAFLGVCWIGIARGARADGGAIVLALIAAALLALGTVAMRRLQGVAALELQAWNAALGIPVLLPLALWLEGDPRASLVTAETRHWLGVFYSGAIASVVGHGLLYALLRRHPVAAITPWLLLTPVAAIALAALFRSERPSFAILLGGALVLLGVLLIALRDRARGRRGAPPVEA